jgi:hypothetical protein
VAIVVFLGACPQAGTTTVVTFAENLEGASLNYRASSLNLQRLFICAVHSYNQM